MATRRLRCAVLMILLMIASGVATGSSIDYPPLRMWFDADRRSAAVIQANVTETSGHRVQRIVISRAGLGSSATAVGSGVGPSLLWGPNGARFNPKLLGVKLWSVELPWCPVTAEPIRGPSDAVLCIDNVDPNGARVIAALVGRDGVKWTVRLSDVLGDSQRASAPRLFVQDFWLDESMEQLFVDIDKAGVYRIEVSIGSVSEVSAKTVAECRANGLRGKIAWHTTLRRRFKSELTPAVVQAQSWDALTEALVDWATEATSADASMHPTNWTERTSRISEAARGLRAADIASRLCDARSMRGVDDAAFKALVVGLNEETVGYLCVALMQLGSEGERVVTRLLGDEDVSEARRKAVRATLSDFGLSLSK